MIFAQSAANSISITIINGAMDSLFYAIASTIVEHLKVLQSYLKSSKLEDEEIEFFVNRHNKIFNWLKILKKIYFPIMFFQMSTTALSLCILGYEIIEVGCIIEYRWFQMKKPQNFFSKIKNHLKFFPEYAHFPLKKIHI
jgi:hypothetical protein